ncbi:MAG: SagB/ThcOx family dehydrogenase [Candidatus Aureabacteria bacterium]|nr:SagB/ThcOx family dehydrogenase [Candidatus Auribacterota bacterium]
MKRYVLLSGCMFLAFLCGVPSGAEDALQAIALPAPRKDAGKPLMQALAQRRSSRAFSKKGLAPQVLGDLLWATCGVNRPDSGKRTAPTAKNMQEIDIYAAMEKGLYRYDALSNKLVPVLAKDIRAKAGEQPFVKIAPVVLIFVADYEKMGNMPVGTKEFYAATDTGFVSQNVYLYCASEGLATVVLGWVNREELAKVMGLRGDQKIILSQPVGYPG